MMRGTYGNAYATWRIVFGIASLLAIWGLLPSMARSAGSQAGIVLVPQDSRPASGQFAQMIARIAGESLRMPPYERLGRFTKPGQPDAILDWIDQLDRSNVRTLIVSTDMLCYGGLIASRDNEVSLATALNRLQRLLDIRKRKPATRLYAFCSTMRLAVTATRATAPWRADLAAYEESKDMATRLNISSAQSHLAALRASLPPGTIEAYENARARNHTVQRALIEAASLGKLDYLIIGQDDAKPYGPHVAESLALHALVDRLNCNNRVYFCEGIDQQASVLVSRTLLHDANWIPRVRVAYSDPLGRLKYANYETKPIEQSLGDEIVASGGQIAEEGQPFDYTLYLNTPKPGAEAFQSWINGLKNELDQGRHVAVADINFSKKGTTDPALFEVLWEKGRLAHLLAYAGWNTAGNTMGTAVPAANVYLMARELKRNPLEREIAQQEFLLHRFVNDVAFHSETRPIAYSMILAEYRDEVYGNDYGDLNDFVQRDIAKHLRSYLDGPFKGRKIMVGNEVRELSDLADLKVWLPWPRAYEVRIQFRLKSREVAIGSR